MLGLRDRELASGVIQGLSCPRQGASLIKSKGYLVSGAFYLMKATTCAERPGLFEDYPEALLLYLVRLLNILTMISVG